MAKMLTIALPLSILFLQTLAPSSAASDRLSLLSFKSLATVSSPGALSSWNDTIDFCRWRGVACNASHPGRVTELELGASGLSGTISASLSNLTYLTTLNLSYNNFVGTIPPELGLLPRLEILDLGSNSLGGVIPEGLAHSCSSLKLLYLYKNKLQGLIPASLSNCTSLQYLILDDNSITGKIPHELGTLPRLKGLYLMRNGLTGRIPPSLGNISTLTDLYLSSNTLQGSIPAELGRLTNLHVLDLLFNRFSGEIPPSIFNFSMLYAFGLGDNNFSGSLPDDFFEKLPNLVNAFLYNNHFEGPIPSSITNATKLRLLSFSENSFTGVVPNNIGSLYQLKSLQLASNRFEASRPEHWDFLASLANCTRLVELDLWKNNFSGSLPASIANLSTTINRLAIGNNPITGSIPAGIGNLKSLEEFDADKGDLSGSLPDTIGELTGLRILFLSENQFTGEIPPSMGNLSQLLELHLNKNRFSGSIPNSLAALDKLNLLDLSYNELSGNVPKALLAVSSLTRFLNLSHNSLAGQLPDSFARLINLNVIDVFSNGFSGTIPASLGICEQLEYLNLANNEFRGTIPKSLGDLKGLLVLNLSQNKLSGPVPTFLEAFLPALQFLNLSFNDFEGEVPAEGRLFGNSSKFSVLGNARLCGGIPELRLRTCSVKKHRPSMSLLVVVVIVAGVLISVTLMILYLFRKTFQPRKGIQIHDPEDGLFTKVSYAELARATDGFSAANLIGEGGFGRVYKGVLGPKRCSAAIKVFHGNMLGTSKSFIAECAILRGIRHRNLVKILTSCSSVDLYGNEFKALVYEYMPNGSLDAWVHPDATMPGNLSVIQRLDIAIDIASALDYLRNYAHEPIVHCDLKPTNVLLREDMAACISDFGMARFLSANAGITSGIKGSIGYIAPECGMGSPISPLWDVYGFGVMLLEMFTGRRPTDDLFTGSLDLHEFVNASFPRRAMEIVDPKLIPEVDEDRSIGDCLLDILEVALTCSKKLPSERAPIDDVRKRLEALRDAYFAPENA